MNDDWDHRSSTTAIKCIIIPPYSEFRLHLASVRKIAAVCSSTVGTQNGKIIILL